MPNTAARFFPKTELPVRTSYEQSATLPLSAITLEPQAQGTGAQNAEFVAESVAEERAAIPRLAAPAWKRGVDIVAASIGLVLLSPLFLLVALYIKLSSRGPVFFRQDRIGHGGGTFRIWKFRTMTVSVEQAKHQAYVCELAQNGNALQKLDRRADFIPLGRWMRVLCIDELPQLLNVLTGTMSLVGPRPDVLTLEQYKPWQLRRFAALPGMTGLWQVSGKNRTTFDEMVELDIQYTQRISPVLDARILLMTLPAILWMLWDESAR